jgi:hypothetical protein
VPLVHELSERPHAIFLILQDVARRYRQTAIPPLTDTDVRQAAEAYAATLETKDRGIIYEHQPGSLTAQRLLAAFGTAVQDLVKETGMPSLERDAMRALRCMERAAKEAKTRLEDSETAYLDLMARLPYPAPEDGRSRADKPAPSEPPAPTESSPLIILP